MHLIKDKISTNFLCFRKIRKFQRQQQKQRKIAIIKKLLKEYEIQRKIDKIKNKTYDYKVRKKERIKSDLEIVGFGVEVPDEIPKDVVPEEEEEEIVSEEEYISDTTTMEPPQSIKPKKPKKEAKKIKVKKEKKAKKAKQKKGKGKKPKKSDEPQKFTLPQIPTVNQRYKVVPDETQKMTDLIKDFPELEKVEHEKVSYEKELTKKDRPDADEDTQTVVTPKELIFKVSLKSCLFAI